MKGLDRFSDSALYNTATNNRHRQPKTSILFYYAQTQNTYRILLNHKMSFYPIKLYISQKHMANNSDLSRIKHIVITDKSMVWDIQTLASSNSPSPVSKEKPPLTLIPALISKRRVVEIHESSQ